MVFIAIVILMLNISECHQHGAYTFDDYTIKKNQNWMSYLDDSTLMNKLRIPGTHDT